MIGNDRNWWEICEVERDAGINLLVPLTLGLIRRQTRTAQVVTSLPYRYGHD